MGNAAGIRDRLTNQEHAADERNAGKGFRWALLFTAAFVLPLIFALVFCLPAQAMMLEMSLADLSSGADTIVQGTVVSVSSQWNAEHNNISTTVTLNVEECLKGSAQPGDQVRIEVAGGTVDGTTQWVSDTPSFKVGETSVVFLTAATRGAAVQVYGQVQGKFEVTGGKIGQQSLSEFKTQINKTVKGISPLSTEPLKKETVSRIFDVSKLGLPKSEISAPEVFSSSQTQTILSENFEGSFPGSKWFVDGSPTWNKTSYKKYAGSNSVWCAGSSLNPANGDYADNMEAVMFYGPFSLSGATAANLSFYTWLKSEDGQDGLLVLMSTDGSYFDGYFLSGDSNNVSGNVNGWVNISNDLTDFYSLGDLCGQSSVYLAFVFVSDSSSDHSYPGAFLDNVRLTKSAPTGVTPQITGITPSSASAGTDSEITITGTNFGDTPGTVNFFYQQGQPKIQGDVLSWSNTSIHATVPVDIINGYPASAGSGPVTVTTSDGVASAEYPFTVTFSYGGIKWDGDSPFVEYYVNDAGDPAKLAAVRSAANSWNTVPGKQFTFSYAAPTTATSASMDDLNEIMWTYLGDPSIIGLASAWSTGGIISEMDIEFNTNFNWSTATPVPPGKMDVQTIATHELGHWLNLRDLYGDVTGYPQDVTKIMYGFCDYSWNKRVLTAADVAGIQWIYPETPAVNISIVLQGGSRPDSGWVVPLTVNFFTPGPDTAGANILTATPQYTCELTTSKSGTTATASTSVTAGTYDITVVSPHCLTNVKRNKTISGASIDINMGTLLEGNADDDSSIGIADFGILSLAYGKSISDTGYDARADFDRSGRVNIADFGLLAVNYLKTSPQTVSP